MICTPAPGSAQAAGVALRPALWVARRVGVRFLGGETWQRVTVAFTVRAGWNQASALQFVFDDAPDAPVRVTFEPGASWAHAGNAELSAGDRATVEELYGPLPAGEAARMFLPIVRR